MLEHARALDTAQTAAAWLSAHLEDHVEAAADLNQYWYSASTIATLCDLVREQCFRSDHSCALDCAFLSTPSLFFALTPAERARSRVLDFDEALGVGEPGFVRYDFHEPTALPPALAGAFRCVVIDPPCAPPSRSVHVSAVASHPPVLPAQLHHGGRLEAVH